MHKKPKQFIPQILLSVALLLFFSCTFDGHEHHDADAHQHDGEIILRRISWHELNSSVPKLSHAIKEANAKNVKGTSLLARDGSAEKTYTINTDEVIAISKDGKTTYTFSITREDETHLTENLVVTLDLSGKMTGRIIVYDLTEQDKTKIEQKQPVDLEGKISYKEVGELTNLPVQLSVSNGSMTLTDCVFSIVVGGGVCPSRQHDLHQMQSGMCSYVNNGSYTPNPETLVQIIVDEDCLNGSTAGGGSGNPSDGNQNPGNPNNPVNNEPIGGNGGNGGNSSNNGNTHEEPDPNSPNPTDPSHDLGGEPVITTPFLPNRTPKNPCEQLKKLSEKPSFVTKMEILKNGINGTHEKGFMLIDNPSNEVSEIIESIIVNGAVAYPWLDIPIDDLYKAYGTGHNHLRNNPENIGIFTPEDICILRFNGLIETAPNNPYHKSTPEKAIAFLITEKGLFAIKINDLNKLNTFAMKYESLLVNEKSEEYLKRFFKNPKEYNILPTSTHNQQVIGFLRFMQDEDIGIDLYEGDKNSIGGWKKLSLNNNSNGTFSFSETPCN